MVSLMIELDKTYTSDPPIYEPSPQSLAIALTDWHFQLSCPGIAHWLAMGNVTFSGFHASFGHGWANGQPATAAIFKYFWKW